MKTSLIPYLNFNGQCREAMAFYQQCLGGELILQKVSESPMSAQMPPGMESNILHSSLTNDHLMLMGSDMIGQGLKPGNAIGLCLQCSSEEEIQSFFKNLSIGAKVKMELHQTFWGATYGELTDQYGFNWMFNFTKN
ncbi:MAG TPA: VOC family protein [Saprospiraceae bacterium]|nr:VOC family protein [Saprospiraceae bacterium]